MNRLLSVLLLLALVVVIGAQFTSLNTGTGVTWNTVDSGNQSGVKRQSIFVLENEGAFQTYAQRTFGRLPARRPNVNWTTEKMVAVHLGERPTSGYGIYVRTITRANAATAVIEAIETTPIPGSMNAQMITSPWTLIKVSRRAADFSLRVQKAPTNIIIQPGQGHGHGPACGCRCQGCADHCTAG